MLKAVLFVVKPTILGRVWIHALKLLYDIFQLCREFFFLSLNLSHHRLEHPFTFDTRLILNLLIPLIAAAKLGPVFLFCFLPNFVFSLLAALLERYDAFTLQLRDGSIIKVVKGRAGENELPAQATDEANARIVEQVDGDDCIEATDEGNDVILVVDSIAFEVQVGELG